MLTKCCLFAAAGLLVATSSLPAQTASPADSPFAGTWFGSFNVTAPDGKLQHNPAVLVLNEAGGQLSGTMGATIDQQTPLQRVVASGDEIRFHMDAAGGLDFTLKRAGDHLTGSATGNVHAGVDVRPAPGLLPHDQLVAEITEADRRLFAAFDSCNVQAYADYLAADLEFYHDKTGRTDYQFQLDSLRQRCAEGNLLRRELLPDSLIVNAAPGFGAIEAGTHRFYVRQKDGTEHLDGTARFAEIWSKQSGTWKLERIISYDHE